MTISKEDDGQSHNKGHTFYAEFNLVCARFVAVEQEEEEEEVQEQEEEEKEEKTMRARQSDITAVRQSDKVTKEQEHIKPSPLHPLSSSSFSSKPTRPVHPHRDIHH